MTSQQVKKEPPKFWNRRQTLYISILCISATILVAAVMCVVLFKEKPISRSTQKEVTVKVDALTQQNLQVLYDQPLFTVQANPLQAVQGSNLTDMVAAIIKTTHGQLPNLKRVLAEMHNVTFVIAQ